MQDSAIPRLACGPRREDSTHPRGKRLADGGADQARREAPTPTGAVEVRGIQKARDQSPGQRRRPVAAAATTWAANRA